MFAILATAAGTASSRFARRNTELQCHCRKCARRTLARGSWNCRECVRSRARSSAAVSASTPSLQVCLLDAKKERRGLRWRSGGLRWRSGKEMAFNALFTSRPLLRPRQFSTLIHLALSMSAAFHQLVKCRHHARHRWQRLILRHALHITLAL